MGARLLLAFVLVTAFCGLSIAAAIHFLNRIGDRFEVVDQRLPRAVSALELSRSAERIVATAPKLLAAADAGSQTEISTALDSESGRLLATVGALGASDANLPTSEIQPIVSALTTDLAALGEVVARRLTVTEQISARRGSITQIGGEINRLLAPWIEVVERETASRSTDANGKAADNLAQLQRHLDLHRKLRALQAKAISVARMLGEASTSRQTGRLDVLGFQLDRDLEELEEITDGLDPRLGTMLRSRLGALRSLADSPGSVLTLRQEELSLLDHGSALVESIGEHSARLTAAVDRLGAAATSEIEAAFEEAVSLQQRSTWLLVLIGVSAVLASALFVWLYVARNVVRRLNALNRGTRAIAGGDLGAEVSVEGADEITAMAQAVETFRKNTLERDALLVEKAQTADRLERMVEERTEELSRSIREVEEKSRALEDANRFKSRFLASASHDLRQPLHALNLFVSQLGAERDSAERERLIGRIGAAIGSMNDLFDALLDMARLEAGVIEPHVRGFAIAPLFMRLRTTFSESAREKGLKLRIVSSGAWVKSDSILLERLLINLVSNAVRYTFAGGVVVGCRRRGRALRIEVWDTGTGIPDEDLPRIFGEFVQLAPGQRGAEGGLGLGLSIVGRLAELLDHRLETVSRVGKGSRFSIILPLAEKRDLVASTTVLIDTPAQRCVLIVEDDPLALDGISGILRSWGCRVIAASGPDAARQALAAGASRPDLIISDLHLGNGQTGMDVIADVRADTGTMIPAFLISGDTTPDCLQEVQARGYRLLHKPVAPIRLRAMVSRMTQPAASPDGVAPPKH